MAAEYYKGEPIWIDPHQRFVWEKPDRTLTQENMQRTTEWDLWPYDGDPRDEDQGDDVPTVQP